LIINIIIIINIMLQEKNTLLLMFIYLFEANLSFVKGGNTRKDLSF